jgi:hypothetical protein
MSEPGDVREQLRRAEERVVQVRSENAALERRLFKPTGLRNWTIAGVLATALAGTLGFVISNRAGYARAAVDRDRAAEEHGKAVERRRLSTEQCKGSLDRKLAELLSCQRSRVPPAPDPAPRPPPRPGPPCNCEAGDPLCSCL